ncbi:MAG: SprT-like domain-containing protein, partial [Clostridia bacterium]|nr:SprT-like domain-containing protein [Clostridia bacterium]
MSSITKRWTEEDFRRELRKIDKHVRETQGIDLSGAELEITFSERARCRLGYYSHVKRMFNFSLAFFNSNVPEESAIDVIRHEYAHYYNHVVNGQYGHGVYFKSACRIVGANPRTY